MAHKTKCKAVYEPLEMAIETTRSVDGPTNRFPIRLLSFG